VIAAIVPVKGFTASKSRLAATLGRAGAEQLARAMLDDVVAALRGVAAIDRVAVVTPDEAVAEAARRIGAQPILELERSESGERARGLAVGESRLNAAIDRAARDLGAGATLVVLGDVAGALSEDLATLVATLEALPAPAAVLAPSRDGGSAALARRPHAAIPSRFGRASAAAHRNAAVQAGVAWDERALPSLAIDLDDDDAVRAFLATPRGGPHTRAALRELGIEARP
jgi:2-phospho-L-lactate guanylyltransferase